MTGLARSQRRFYIVANPAMHMACVFVGFRRSAGWERLLLARHRRLPDTRPAWQLQRWHRQRSCIRIDLTVICVLVRRDSFMSRYNVGKFRNLRYTKYMTAHQARSPAERRHCNTDGRPLCDNEICRVRSNRNDCI